MWCYSHGYTKVPQWGRSGNEVPQKLKHCADIVYRFGLQKRSKFENFAQFAPVLDQFVLWCG